MDRGNEKRVEDLFVSYLEREGWAVKRQVDFLDVYAERDGEVLRAEVKGYTGTNTNLDIDTMFGQLLRRMTTSTDRFAVAVPTEGVGGVVRIPKWVRETLRIEVYAVDVRTGEVSLRSDV